MTTPDVPMRSYLGTPATAPGPAGPEMLRHTMAIRRDPLGFLALMRDTYGDVVQFPIPRPPTYLLSDVSGARRVLVDNAGNYGKGTIQYRSLSLVTGDGLLTADDPLWRTQRPIVQPAFHRRALSGVEAIVSEETVSVTRQWSIPGRQVVVDVESAMLDITLRTVGRALFGDDLRGSSAALAEATIAALKVVIQRSRVPISVPGAIPTPANRRLARSMALLEDAVARLVARRRSAAPPDDPGSGPLLLDLLLAADLPEKAVRDQVVTFLVAGHETAASGLTWALWLLAGAPEWQERVAVDPAAARAAADEALRLFPPAWVITRAARGEDVVAGRTLPSGALVIVSPYLIHRDPRYWPEPLRFDPARFLAEKPERMPQYLPFGAGMRLCIGRDFARWEMTAVLQQLCRGLVFSRTEEPAPRAMPEVTLRPAGGMRLAVAPRSR